MSNKTENQLPEALQAEYEIVGKWPTGDFIVNGVDVAGFINFSKMNKPFAEALIKKGFKGLKRKEAPAAKASTEVEKSAKTDKNKVAAPQNGAGTDSPG